MQEYTIVHYGELRLKGRNRNKFEDKLVKNIKQICGGKVHKLSSSLLCENSILDKFKYVSGISWYAPCIKLNKDYEELINHFISMDDDIFKDKKSFAIRVKRSDKSFEYDSNELSRILGDLVRTKYDIKVNLGKPDLTIHVEISEYMLVYYERITGIGGFPNGIHGKVLCLLSGGIDSPVAAYTMMRKGCHVDFIHFHAFTDNQKVIDSKITNTVRVLTNYQMNSTLYIVPSYILDLNMTNYKDISGYQMIIFRRFIFMIAEYIAKTHKYKAIVSGDSLGQVASQTLENLHAVLNGIDILVIQPLIALDKQEIVDMAKRIGSYELSVQAYKDCCAIISDKPAISSDLKKIYQIELELNINNIIQQTIQNIESTTINIE